jgi:hypothetical protein
MYSCTEGEAHGGQNILYHSHNWGPYRRERAAVTIEPGQGALDDSAAREDLKTASVGHAAHDMIVS